MGVDFGDANGDGHLDIFVTNFSHETNTLYLGSSSALFTDATEEAGLSTPSLGPLGWGTRFIDLDNDGDEDLFVANGHVYPNVEEVDATTTYRQRSQVYLNDGRGNFVEAQWSAEAKSNRGAAFGDLDSDGDPDVVVSAIDDRPALLRNDFVRGRALPRTRARRTDEQSRRRGRARPVLLLGQRTQVKEAHASGSVLSSNDPRLLFGLGSAAEADEIDVRLAERSVSRGSARSRRPLSRDRRGARRLRRDARNVDVSVGRVLPGDAVGDLLPREEVLADARRRRGMVQGVEMDPRCAVAEELFRLLHRDLDGELELGVGIVPVAFHALADPDRKVRAALLGEARDLLVGPDRHEAHHDGNVDTAPSHLFDELEVTRVIEEVLGHGGVRARLYLADEVVDVSIQTLALPDALPDSRKRGREILRAS